jgi:hypothetical protein
VYLCIGQEMATEMWGWFRNCKLDISTYKRMS